MKFYHTGSTPVVDPVKQTGSHDSQLRHPAVDDFIGPGGMRVTVRRGTPYVPQDVPLYVRTFLYRMGRGWFVEPTFRPEDNPANGWLRTHATDPGGFELHQRIFNLDGTTDHLSYVITWEGSP